MSVCEPTKSKLKIIRDGRSTTKLVPLPTIIVDRREQLPYQFESHKNWIGGTKTESLPTGDYSVEGYQNLISLERKTLNDIVGSLMSGRNRFLNEIERLSEFRYKCLCIEASRTAIKTPYSFCGTVKAHPNGIVGSLDAIAAKYGIIIHYGDNRTLSEEFAASWLSKCYTYEWLDKNGHGRVLQEGDL